MNTDNESDFFLDYFQEDSSKDNDENQIRTQTRSLKMRLLNLTSTFI